MFSPEWFCKATSTFAILMFVTLHEANFLSSVQTAYCFIQTSLAEAASNGYAPVPEAQGRTEN